MGAFIHLVFSFGICFAALIGAYFLSAFVCYKCGISFDEFGAKMRGGIR